MKELEKQWLVGLNHSEGTQTLVALRRDDDDTWGNMTPEQARALARVLTDAADKAAEETWEAEARVLADEKFNGDIHRARIEKMMTQYNEEEVCHG